MTICLELARDEDYGNAVNPDGSTIDPRVVYIADHVPTSYDFAYNEIELYAKRKGVSFRKVVSICVHALHYGAVMGL